MQVKSLKQEEVALENFVEFSGKLLALAHSRSDEDHADSFLSGNFERTALKEMRGWKKFAKKMNAVCADYAAQVEEDWQNFRKEWKELL